MANPANSQYNDKPWCDFSLYAQETMTSIEAIQSVYKCAQAIFENINMMDGSKANLLHLQQSFIAILTNKEIKEGHKKLLATGIQKTLQGKEVESGSKVILKEIKSQFDFYLAPNKANQEISIATTSHNNNNVLTLTTQESSLSVKTNQQDSIQLKSPHILVFPEEKENKEFFINNNLQEKLIANSSYFKAIWEGAYKEQNQEKLALEGILKEDFVKMIDLLGKSEPLTLQEAVDILGIATYFQVAFLRDKCFQSIETFAQGFGSFDEEDLNTFTAIYKHLNNFPEIDTLISETLQNHKEKFIKLLQKEYSKNFCEFIKNFPLGRLAFMKEDWLFDQHLASLARLSHLKEIVF